MKKVLLLIISLLMCLFCVQITLAYETVLVDFPQNQGWHAAFYGSRSGETILQYVPAGQTKDNWTKTVVFHSYKDLSWTDNAAFFLDKTTADMEARNSTQLYKNTKHTEADSIAVRCVEKNAQIPRQCEIYRVSKSYEGLISMHYINKNIQDYKDTYNQWYQIIKNVRIYYSYYMDDRIMDKATSFEL